MTVQSVHTASGFRQILERVWQERVGAESRSLGDYAMGTDLKEIPNGSLKREYLLTFGTTLGACGTALLKNRGILSSGEVTFTPTEVSSSIQGLISRNEAIVSALKFFSMVFVLGGGGILLLTAVPLVLRAFGYRTDDDESSARPARSN